MWFRRSDFGGVAQLGERVNGIHEVRGSIPLASIAGQAPAMDCWTLPRHRVPPMTGLLRE